jgi:small-conductance mechanosensitive channel
VNPIETLFDQGLFQNGSAALTALSATLALWVALAVLRRSAGRLVDGIKARPALQSVPPRVAGAELLRRRNPLAGAEVLRGLIALVRSGQGLLVMLALWAWALAVFSAFPATRNAAAVLLGYVLEPARAAGSGLVDYLPRLFFIGVAAAIAYALIRIARFTFAEIGKGTFRLEGFPAEWATPTYRITRFVILAFSAVMIYPYLPGAQTRAFEGISLFLGVLLSLGSSGMVSNLVAGTILTYTRAFRVGDRIRIADTEGDVIGHALLATRIRTIKNVDITVPNARVLAEHIVNYSAAAQGPGLILHDQVTIGYDVPWRQVHELLIDAALKTGHVLAEPRPYVLQSGLDDFYARYTINATTREPSRMAATYSELRQNIQDAFHGAGIEITSAHYMALRDGSRAARPDAPPSDGATPLRVALVAPVEQAQS